MNRSFWLILLLFFSATAVGAGWFAVNAPEASRPSFANLGGVRLAKETPPLPPAPLSRSGGKGFENVLRRPLFRSASAEGRGSRRTVGKPRARDLKSVSFRVVLAPVAAAPAVDFAAFTTPREPKDDFQAAFGLAAPKHEQFFGGHLMAPDSLAADGAPLKVAAAPAGGADKPSFRALRAAKIPRPRPKKDAIKDRAAPSVAATATRPALAPDRDAQSGRPDENAGARALRPEEEIVLLGVLMRQSGADRALIRLSSGESRRVTLGDEVAGWRVSSISADSIKLKRASVTREIKVPQ